MVLLGINQDRYCCPNKTKKKKYYKEKNWSETNFIDQTVDKIQTR